MFGLSLREKAEAVIEKDFHYLVSDMQRHVFNMLVSEGKAMQQNEYSVAIFYMFMTCNMLMAPFETEDGIIDPKEGRTDEEKKEANEFVTAHMNTILNIKHLANSPERDIEDMAKEVLRNAGLEESENEDVQDSSSVTEENEEDIELLVKTSEIFLKHLAINKSLLSSTPAGKYLSNYQLDFTFTLLLMGAIDSVAQSRDISMDSCVLALTRSLLDNELLGFELDDVMLVIDRVFEAQSEPWGFQVIMQGGQAMASISDSDATDALPLMDLFNNEDTIKELASGIIA